MQYMVVIEKGKNNFSAYVPDLPGCISTGKTKRSVLKLIREGIQFHLEGMIEDSAVIPKPSTMSEYVDIEI